LKVGTDVGTGLGAVTARQDCDEARHLSARLLIRPAVGGPGRCRRPRRQIQRKGAKKFGQ